MKSTQRTSKEKKTKRGNLKATISTSEPVVDSSGDFSIFVIIENPYDVPVTLYSVETHIPVQLIDSVWHEQFVASELETWNAELAKKKGWEKIPSFAKYWLNIFKQKIRKPYSPRIAEAVGTDTKIIAPSKNEIPSNLSVTFQDKTSEPTIVGGSFNEIWHLKFPKNPTNDELDRIFMKVEDYRSGKVPVILQPGNAVVKQFILRAKDKLFFRPIAYNFQIQVRYAVDKEENLDTIPFNLQIRANITSIMLGSIFGSMFGAIARALGQTGESLSISVMVLSAIFGAIAIIAFARKENAQTIVSIEDFWGGVLIGFLIGYLGESYFRSIVGV